MGELRFKTKAEFIAEYGEEWRLGVGTLGIFPSGMDYLFGLPCTDDWVGGSQNIHREKTKGSSYWHVVSWMVTDKPLSDSEPDTVVEATPPMPYHPSRRDYFAIQILNGWLSNTSTLKHEGLIANVVADVDRLIAELDKPKR